MIEPLQADESATALLELPAPEDSHSADGDLQRRIRNFLQSRGIPHASSLQIDAHHGVVTLQGVHRSYYQKQLCINCCQRVAGVVQLIDATKVQTQR